MTSNPQEARDDLIAYAATTRTVTADGLAPLLDAYRDALLAAAPAAASSSVVGQATRDRIAEALALRENGPASDGRGWFRDEEQHQSFLTDADAVLAVLPPPADRAAIRAEAFREAAVATRRGAFADTFDRMADAELRRLADEAQQSAVGAQASADLIEDYLRFLRGQGPEPDLSDLAPQQREAVAGQFEIVKALTDRDPELPPLDRDPVALRLGLLDAAPAAECSAQHRNFDDGRLCIRAAQHRGDHIDERGFHWSDTVAVYPVGGGTFRSGVRPSAVGARQPDTQTPFVARVLELFSATHADAYGDLFWHVDNGEVQLFANVSDVFAWGGADCEPIAPDTLPALEQAYADLKAIEAEEFTAELYAARQRGMRPQGAAYPSGTHEAWRKVNALYDACGPERELGLGNPKPPPAASSAVPGRSAATDTHEETDRG